MLNVEGSYFTFTGFEITGGGHGIRLGNANNAVIEDMTIHAIADVGISCNRPGHVCDRLTVRRNEIYDTGGRGEGMYIGCNDNACQVTNSLFAENFIHDLGGDQGDGIEIKTGSYGNTVRDNVIVNALYPAITLYGFPDGAGPFNVVERNFIWGTINNGIQIVGQVIVRNNIIVDAGLNGIQSKPSQGFEPHDVTIVHNTVYASGTACMKTNDWSGSANQVIANNAFYCAGSAAADINGGAPGATIVGNIGLGSISAPGGIELGAGDADLGNPATNVFYPPTGSVLIDSGDSAQGASEDYNGSARGDGSPDVGAYEHTAPENPGWMLAAGFRGDVPDPPPPMTDGGVGPLPDGGVTPPPDGGGVTDSGSSPDDDAGSGVDSGGGGESDGGCGCRTTSGPGSSAAWFALLMVVTLFRRRR
ncbi:MAG: right-handed parallel beta-helix repeat-containing protein [Deltaproteobacteria bacterium]|nr:right-handed parallel beta-helix repeat-containing protein [Deltaproteobacteria bacterium]